MGTAGEPVSVLPHGCMYCKHANCSSLLTHYAYSSKKWSGRIGPISHISHFGDPLTAVVVVKGMCLLHADTRNTPVCGDDASAGRKPVMMYGRTGIYQQRAVSDCGTVMLGGVLLWLA